MYFDNTGKALVLEEADEEQSVVHAKHTRKPVSKTASLTTFSHCVTLSPALFRASSFDVTGNKFPELLPGMEQVGRGESSSQVEANSEAFASLPHASRT